VTRRRCTVCRIPEGGCVCAKGPTFAEERAAPHPLDTPGIELRDAVGWAVFTASEGEDPRLHAWFAKRPTAEAYVKACAAVSIMRVTEAGFNLLSPHGPGGLFEPSITSCAAKFASSYGDPDVPERRLVDALTEHTDDHEKRAWKDLLEMALPWLRHSERLMRRPTPDSLKRVIDTIVDILNPTIAPDRPVHFVTYKRTVNGNFLISECKQDAHELDGRFTNDQDAVTCTECLRALGL
jgi:hypothetical protein